jgi:hypothetical protein
VSDMTYIDGTATPPWVTWNGSWGGSSGNLLGIGVSPASPGNQAPYQCTQAGWNCSTQLQGDVVPPLDAKRVGSRSAPSASAAPPSPARDAALAACKTWYDGGLAAYACSPSELRRAVSAGRLRARGSFSIKVDGRRTANAGGLVQVIGGPISRPTSVQLIGKPPTDEVIILNFWDRGAGREYAIRLRNVTMQQPKARIAMTVTRGRPGIKLIGTNAHLSISVVKERK